MPSPETNAPADWTIGSLLTWTRAHFEKRQIDEPRLCAELLLAKAMGMRRIELYAKFEQKPSDAQRAEFREMVRAAGEHKPIAYLIGTKEFYSLEFQVTPDVLIPRPETELLIERAQAWCKEHPQDRYDLLDIGTGSGCIAITMAKRQPALRALATDISEAALGVARENGKRHNLTTVQFLHADLFSFARESIPAGGFDIILSNPPYIAENDKETLPENVRNYEPATALFAASDGVDLYERMAKDIADFLKPGGLFAVEIGFGQADAVKKIFTEGGTLTLTGCYKDGGGIERVLAFTLPA